MQKLDTYGLIMDEAIFIEDKCSGCLDVNICTFDFNERLICKGMCRSSFHTGSKSIHQRLREGE